MKLSLILANPSPGSFNHAIAETPGRRFCATGTESSSTTSALKASIRSYPSRRSPKALRSRRRSPATARDPRSRWHHCRASELVRASRRRSLRGGSIRAIAQAWPMSFWKSDSGEGVPLGLLHARTALASTRPHPLRRETGFRRSAGNPVKELRFRTVRREQLPSPCLRRDRHEHSRAARRLAGGSRRNTAIAAFLLLAGQQAGATDAGLCRRPHPTGDAAGGRLAPRLLCRAARPGGNCQATRTGRSRAVVRATAR